MKFHIREATQSEYKGICEVFEELDSIHRQALPHIFRQPEGPARTEESISAIISDENADLFVTETNNQIIGFVHVLTRQAPPVPIMVSRRYAVLENLAIRGGYRRLGVGTSLLKRAHQWALSRKVSQIESNVWEFNEEAITFYGKHGYTTTRRWISRRLPQLIPITPVQRCPSYATRTLAPKSPTQPRLTSIEIWLNLELKIQSWIS